MRQPINNPRFNGTPIEHSSAGPKELMNFGLKEKPDAMILARPTYRKVSKRKPDSRLGSSGIEIMTKSPSSREFIINFDSRDRRVCPYDDGSPTEG